MLLLFLLHSMGLSLFRYQGSLCRDENIASTGGAFLFLVMLLLGGFLLAKNDIPDWWIWFYWCAHTPSFGCQPPAARGRPCPDAGRCILHAACATLHQLLHVPDVPHMS